MTEDEIESGIEAVLAEVKGSYELAITSLLGDFGFKAIVVNAAVESILTTVNDAVSNHWDDLLSTFYGEEDDDG